MKKNIHSLFYFLVNSYRKSSIISISLVLITLVIIASIFSPYFLDLYNLQSVIRDLAFIGMISVGQSLLLIIGELDLSVGKIASLCGILSGIMMVQWGWDPYFSLIISLLLGAVLGTINGLIITRLRLNSMVVTIGMAGVYGGVNLVLTKGKAITGIPESIYILGKGSIGPIPYPFIFAIIVLSLLLLFVKLTATGRYIYAIGNNREAAKILGIKVNKIRVLVYSLVGTISSLAGILYVARLGSAQSAIGETWPMNSIASSVIGGMALTGGGGNPAGAMIGAAIISIIQNMIVLFGVNVYWQSAVSGFVVVIAISFGSLLAMYQEKKQKMASLSKNKRQSTIYNCK